MKKRNYTKVLSSLLALIMVISTAVPVFASEAQQGADVAYIPLRLAFEGSGADVGWDNGNITVQHNGDEYIFTSGSTSAYRNGSSFQLHNPIAVVEGRAKISFDDAAFLFGNTGELSQTVATAVTTTFQLMEMFNVPGMSLAIVDAETGFTWTQGLGFANTANRTPMDENTVVHLGSLAKTFVSVSVMQLVEQGKLNLDTPIVEYLPEFSVLPSLDPEVGGNYRNITARMLLTHTSGIPENFFGYASLTTNGHSQEHMNRFLERLSTYHMITAEGTTVSYNNNALILLGILVARLTGDNNAFDDFVTYTNENVFQAAGMNRTSFVTTNYLQENMMRRYTTAGAPGEYLYLNVLPAGSAVSTASNISRYMKFLLNNGSYDGTTLVSANSLQQMLTSHNDSPFGLSFVISDALGFRSVGHNGGIPDFANADMVLNLDSGLGVFVASNSGSSAIPIHGTALASVILHTAVTEKTGAVNLPEPTGVVADPNATPLERNVAELAAFEGLYMQGPAHFFIELMNDVLHLILVQQEEEVNLPMIPLSDGSFETAQGRMWLEMVDGTAILKAGNVPVPLAVRVDPSMFELHEDFENWVGSFVIRHPANESSMAEGAIIGIDSRGIPFETQIMHGGNIGPRMPVTKSDYDFSQARNIERNEDGRVISFDYFGATFVRV